MQINRRGSIQIIVSSAFFGALPLLTRIGYNGGANAVTLLAVRFSIAAALIWTYFFSTKTKIIINLKQIITFAIVAVFGYGVMAYSYFNSFHYIPSSMSAMIMFCYPVIVTYLSAILLKSPLTKAKIIALIFVTTGAILMAGGELAFNLVGIMLAFTSALFYAIYIVYLGSKFTYRQEAKVLTAWIILFSAFFFTLFGAATGDLILTMDYQAWISVTLMAIFSTVIAIMAFYAGVQKIGPSLAAIISTVEPLTALILGIVVLHEKITLIQFLGAFCILIGVIYVQLPGPKPRIDWKARI